MRKIGFISNLGNNLRKWLLWCPEKPEPRGFDWGKVSMKLSIARAIGGKSLRLPLLALVLGLGLLVVSSIPMTTVQETIDISFTVAPGVVYGPHMARYIYPNLNITYDERLAYMQHKMPIFPTLSRSVLRGEVIVEGESIYLAIAGSRSHSTAQSWARPPKAFLVEKLTPGEPYSFVFDPASDFYFFIFDSTEASSEASVRIRLEETWTRPIALSSGPHLLGGFSGILMSLAGSLQLVTRRLSQQ